MGGMSRFCHMGQRDVEAILGVFPDAKICDHVMWRIAQGDFDADNQQCEWISMGG